MNMSPKNFNEWTPISSVDEAENAYFDHLLNESINGYFREIGGEFSSCSEATIMDLTDRWRRDFAARFGEHPSHSLVYQCERCIRRIRTLRGPFASISAARAAPMAPREIDPVQPVGIEARSTPNNRPADTVGRMRIEWSPNQPVTTEFDDLSSQTRGSLPAKRGTHASRADSFNLLAALLVVGGLLLLGGLLYFAQSGETAKNRRADERRSESVTKAAADSLPDSYAGQALEETMGQVRKVSGSMPRRVPETASDNGLLPGATTPRPVAALSTLPSAASPVVEPIPAQTVQPAQILPSEGLSGPVPDLLGMPKSLRNAFSPQGGAGARFQTP
jgi:hypothetical protein